MITRGDRTSGHCDIVLDDVEVVLATHFEAERLPVRGTQTIEPTKDDHMSGGGGVIFRAEQPGDGVSYKVRIPAPGTYNLKAGVRTDRSGGQVRLTMDGSDNRQVQDAYSTNQGYEVLDFGSLVFGEAGEKTLRFEVTGKNPRSEGYLFVLDYIDLVR